MSVVKQLMELGAGSHSVVTSEGINISGEFDMDNLCGTLSFNLPYAIGTSDGNLDFFKQLKKYDTCNLYYGTFEEEPSTPVTTADLNPVFMGYINSIKLSKEKNAITYSIECLGTLGLANERNLEYKKTSDTLVALITAWFQISGLDFIPIRNEIPVSKLVPSVDGGKNLKEVMQQFRDKYGVIIHQGGDGAARIFTPVTLKNNANGIDNAYDFDLHQGNLFNIDYGDLTSNINAVVMLGFYPSFGVAIDAVAVQNNGGRVNYQIFDNRDLHGEEACQEAAQNKLLDILKNYSVSFKTIFDARFAVGQPFTIKDYDKYTGTEVFIIKKYAFTISKTDVSCTVTGYTHSLTLLPSEVVIGSTGVADVDVLQIQDKGVSLIENNSYLT